MSQSYTSHWGSERGRENSGGLKRGVGGGELKLRAIFGGNYIEN